MNTTHSVIIGIDTCLASKELARMERAFAGLSRSLPAQGHTVIEVTRPDRQHIDVGESCHARIGTPLALVT